MNDDVFDFFYEALPGYEEVGRRRILLGCWGAFQNPDVCDYRYENMNDWGNEMYVTPGVVVDGELVTTNLVDINLGIRILLGSSYYEDWVNEETFVDKDPLGNPVDKRHPWNQTTLPKPQKRDLDGGNYSWVMSPRWLDKRTGDHLALDTGGGALARLWATALAEQVDTPYVKSTGQQRDRSTCRKTPNSPETTLEWKIPQWSNAHRARPRADLLRRLRRGDGAALPRPGPATSCAPGDTKVFEDFEVPDEAIGCGFHEAVRGVLSHHMVIRDGKIANYHPYPPTPWNGSPTRHLRHARARTRTPSWAMPIFEENGPDDFRGIDIMRAVRSFDPCLPCGVHMYLGNGQDAEAGALADVRGPARRLGVGDGRSRDTRAGRPDRRPARAGGGLRRPGRPRDGQRARGGAARPLRRRALTGRGTSFPTVPAWPRTSSSPICSCCTGSIRSRSRSACGLALAEVRPYLESHGGDVELLAVAEDGVRVRMQGNCNGCPSSAVTLKLAIEEAIHKYAPEIDRIDAEEAEPEPAGPALIQLAPLDPAERLNCPAPAAGT